MPCASTPVYARSCLCVPVISSSGREPFLEEIPLDNYRGLSAAAHPARLELGQLVDALRRAVRSLLSGASHPVQ